MSKIIDYQLLHETAAEKITNYEMAFKTLQIGINGISAATTLERAKEFANIASQALSLCIVANEAVDSANEAPTPQGVGYHAEGSDMERNYSLMDGY